MGWANVVALSGVPDQAVVVDRRDLPLRPESGIAFPYHAAADVDEDERDEVVAAGRHAAAASASLALADLAAEIGVEAVGVVVARGVNKIPLARVLASSRLFHMAEGAVYQDAVRTAAADLGLPVTTIAFADAESHPCWETVSALGKALGPPWRKDHKFAATAAWAAALASTPTE